MPSQARDTGSQPWFRRLRLRFDESLEGEFRNEYFRRSVPQIRGAFIMAIIATATAEILNVTTPQPDQIAALLTVVPVLALSMVATAVSFTEHLRKWSTVLVLLIAAGGVYIFSSQTITAPDDAGGQLVIGTLEFVLLPLWLVAFSGIGFRAAAIGSIACALAWYGFSAMVDVGVRFGSTTPFDMSGNTDPGTDAWIIWVLLVMTLAIGWFLERYQRNDFLQRRELEAERAKSDRLLYQMLPPSIADRLRNGEFAIADAISEVSVLFADLSGYTQLAAQLPPAETMALLNRLFAEFDSLAVRHGVEKIVTTGDGFIAVSGAPEWRTDHTERVAALALDMQRAVNRLNVELEIDLRVRIGIHTGGPVVSGVIGSTKYLYSIVGDAMNVASRMESHGVPGAIHVSASAHERLQGAYRFSERGEIDVKGKGLMRTYLLEAPTGPALPA